MGYDAGAPVGYRRLPEARSGRTVTPGQIRQLIARTQLRAHNRADMRYKSVLLFGAPGSGKGTQGKIIGTIPGFYHSATGDIFRSLDLTSEMGRKFWEYSSRGQLVPDEFTIKLWKRHIQGMEMINQFRPDTEFL